MLELLNNSNATIKIYHGYGHKDNLTVFGHVFKKKIVIRNNHTNNFLINSLHLIKLFFIKPLPEVDVQLQWEDQRLFSKTNSSGFFCFEWKSNNTIEAGWHSVIVNLLDENGKISRTGEGKIFVPHSTQYAFISDIDDTVLISYSGKTFKKLVELFTKHPRKRKAFDEVVKFYQLLSLAHTEPDMANPFFYVSSSEWNLYDDLKEFFRHNNLPEGVFLLNDIKNWYQLFKTGNTKHQGKLIRIERILNTFPKQKFIILGDNSQKDPEIYLSIANKYPDSITAIYIRNLDSATKSFTEKIMLSIQNNRIQTLIYNHSGEAILHAKETGLI